jgi:hypothetical protein
MCLMTLDSTAIQKRLDAGADRHRSHFSRPAEASAQRDETGEAAVYPAICLARKARSASLAARPNASRQHSAASLPRPSRTQHHGSFEIMHLSRSERFP